VRCSGYFFLFIIIVAQLSPALSSAAEFKIPILCYHQVSNQSKGSFTISPEVFEQQMRYLYVKGYTVIPLERLVSFMRLYHSGRAGRIFLPRKAVVITFDDNYSSIYRIALYILKKYKFSGTNFIYTRFMGSRNWAIYRRMIKEGLVLGSHTLNHVDLALKKKGESPKEYKRRIFKEIEGSKRKLEKVLKVKVKYLAYPFGTSNKTVRRISRLAGYAAMFSALGGYVTDKTSFDAIPRFTMFRKFDMKMFRTIVSGGWHKKMKTYHKRQFVMRDYNFKF